MTAPGKAVFLSYASQDAEAAKRICEALRAVGVEVWFDQSELRGGDAWDAKIRKQIKECALFVPIISAHTQARTEGYFRLEWHLAEQRSLLMAKGRPFIVPVAIDGTPDGEALVPDGFTAVQWTRLPGGQTSPEFAAHVRALLAWEGGSRGSRGAAAADPPVPRGADGRRAPVIPDYELVRLIGSGSYGDVWLARGVTGIFRAVKVVWRDRFENAEPFEREFRGLKQFAAISLKTEGQMALLHIGRNDAAGFFYYVMELADDADHGRTFDPVSYTPLTFKEWRRRRGRIPARDVAAAGGQLASGLAALHARGLVHRDIKPSNAILVEGRAKLADIGLVTAADEARTFIGTSGYVPPEGPGTPAADVYALGLVLYELATGLRWEDFPKLPADLERPGPEREAYFALNEVLLRACAPLDQGRYREAGEMAADLGGIAAGRRRLRMRGLWLAGAGVALAAAAMVTWHRATPAAGKASEGNPPAIPAATRPTVAVLPFAFVGDDRSQEYHADGITEEVLDSLARERSLWVAARTSAFSFKGRTVAAAEIGRTLGVGQLVEGSVQRVGDRLRVRVQLTRIADGATESLGSFDRPAAEVFALQDEVSRTVLAKLTGQPMAAAGTEAPTQNFAAYDAYLQGRALQARSAANSLEAIKQYERAVELDPAFAAAWARLALAHFRQVAVSAVGGQAHLDACERAWGRALALRPGLPDALIARAHWTRFAKGDLAAAQADLDRAVAVEAPTAEWHTARSVLAHALGDIDEAFRQTEAALALDPQNGDTVNAAGLFYQSRGRFAEADELFARAIVLQGDASMAPQANRLTLRYQWRGADAAVRLLDRLPLTPSIPEQWRALNRLLIQGRPAEARALAEKIEAEADAVVRGNPQARPFRVWTGALRAIGWDALARQRAAEQWPRLIKRHEEGERSGVLFAELVRTAHTLGRTDEAAARMEEWKRHLATLPGGELRRQQRFTAGPACLALLGRADEAMDVLEEWERAGIHQWPTDPGYEFQLAALATHPRYRAWLDRRKQWAAAQPDPPDDILATRASIRWTGPNGGQEVATAPAPITEARKLLAQANTLLETGDDMNRENLRLVEDLLDRASALDPADGEVLAAQALVSDTLISNGSDRTRARLETLRAQAERALKLAPTSDQAAFAYALYLWRVDFFSRQESAAGRESRQRLRALVAKAPENGAYRRALAFLLVDDPATRDEAFAEWERAHQIAGGDAVAMAQAALNHFFAGNMAEAERAVAASLAIRPLGRALTTDVLLKLAWRGDLDGAAAAMQRWPEWLAREDRGAYVAWTVWLWRNEPEKAVAAIRAVSRDLLNDTLYRGPRAVLEAFALEAGGRREAAQEAWAQAARDVEGMSGQGSIQGWMRVLVRAKLGDIAGADTALQAMLQAWKEDEVLHGFITSTSPFCYPEPRELITGPTVASFPTFARRIGGENYRGARTVPRAALRLNPAFAVWRADPRFAELVAAAPAPEGADQTGARPAALGAPADKTSVAILPFENLSAGPEDALFTDGMHAEMISTLGRLPGLRVISRNSAQRYRDTKLTLAEIGRELDVANIVTGSVRRAGSKVRINLELRRASDEALLWSSPRVEKEFADVWALQDEMADAVARVLQVRADSGWYVGAKLMTRNERAYQLFLQARDIPQTKGPSLESFREQVALCEEVMKLDPDFMYGAALAASAYAYLYTVGDPDPLRRREHAARSKFWAERASQLMPGGGGDGGLAVYYAMVERNPEEAAKYAENEVRALPNDANGYNRLASSLQDYGRWREARDAYDRALALDPFNVRVLHNRILYFANVRRPAEFEAALARSLQYAGRNIDIGLYLYKRMMMTGAVPAENDGSDRISPYWQSILLWHARRFPEVLALAEAESQKSSLATYARLGWLQTRGCTLELLGRGFERRAMGEAMLRELDALPPGADWEAAGIYPYRAWGLMLAERQDEALVLARRYLEEMSRPSQTSGRWYRQSVLAELHAWAGQAQEAVALLGPLLRVPSGVTVHRLRLDPVWDRIRDDPGFQALLADPRNAEPL